MRCLLPIIGKEVLSNSKFKIQNEVKNGSSVELLPFFCRADRSNMSDRNYENVAIKREQRLLADYAEHEQRKDCEAGLIMGE